MALLNPANMNPTALGSLMTAQSPGSPIAFPPGSQGNVLMADSGNPSGLVWGPLSGVGSLWTPIVFGELTAGTASYNQQTGNVFVIGNLAIVSAIIQFNFFTGTGNMLILLPVPCVSALGTPVSSMQYDGTYTTGTNCVLQILSGGNNANILTFGVSTPDTPQLCLPSGNIRFTAMYLTTNNP